MTPLHSSPCKHIIDTGEHSYCSAEIPIRSMPDCDGGSERYCANALYEPTNLYQDTSDGHFVFGVDISGDEFILIAKGA